MKLKNLKIDKLALVERGANKVNRSVLKADVTGKIFKGEDADEKETRQILDDPKELIKSSEILEDVCGVYEIANGEVQDKLGEIIKHYNGQLPKIENKKTEVVLTTAEELLKEFNNE